MKSNKETSSLLLKKNECRKANKEKISLLDENKKKLFSEKASLIFTSSSLYKSSSLILSYNALPSEISTEKINEKTLEDKKLLAFPRVHKNTEDMDFYFCSSLENKKLSFEKGSFGISEPLENNKNILKKEFFTKENTVTVIVPGLAFDKNGGRLGKGKGFYDRYIKKLYQMAGQNSLNIFLLGMAFFCQIEKSLPLEDHDILMNGLLTEKELIIF